MRIKILFNPSNEELPLHSQHIVNGYIHKCLGEGNPWHDADSNYCVSALHGGVRSSTDRKKESFPNGAFIIVSTFEDKFLSTLILGLLKNKSFHKSMTFKTIEHIQEQFYNGWNHFALLTPVLMKKHDRYDYYEITNDPDFRDVLKAKMLNKLNVINEKFSMKLKLDDFDIQINDHKGNYVHHVVMNKVKPIYNAGNRFQISVRTNKAVAELIYSIGIGQSCGCGFGTVYKTENHRLYKIENPS